MVMLEVARRRCERRGKLRLQRLSPSMATTFIRAGKVGTGVLRSSSVASRMALNRCGGSTRFTIL
jgi:hypothetical protein